MAIGGIGGWVGSHLPFDPTPGFNLAASSTGQPYIAASGTRNAIGTGSNSVAKLEPNKESFRSGGKIYNAGGDVIGTYNAGNDNDPTGTNYPGNTLGATTGPSAQDLSAYNSYKTQANDDLSRLLNSYGQTKQSLNSSYDIKGNQLESSKAHADSNYQNAVTDQNQNLLRQQNQVQQGTHNAYQNLMNLLGAYGGGGTSVAQQWAPEAAQHFMNFQLGDANQNTASNLRDLNTTYGNFTEDYKNNKKTLEDQRRQDLANADSQYNDTRTKLSRILDQINGRAAAPGDVGSALNSLDIPSINFVKPTYTGETPVYTAPNISTFEAAIPTSSFASPASVSNSAATPTLAFLLNQQKRQQQPAIA